MRSIGSLICEICLNFRKFEKRAKLFVGAQRAKCYSCGFYDNVPVSLHFFFSPVELFCYKCKYQETNGAPDGPPGEVLPGPEDKYNCLYDPDLLEYEQCDEPLPPGRGYVHRCYTSVYRKITRRGDFGKL